MNEKRSEYTWNEKRLYIQISYIGKETIYEKRSEYTWSIQISYIGKETIHVYSDLLYETRSFEA